MQLSLSGVNHSYGSRLVLYELNLNLEEGEIGALIGPSGTGKTTVLSCIAGLEPVAAGEIRIGGELVSSATVNVPVEQRRLGMMFQDSSLFPHMDVKANIGFGLRCSPTVKAERVAELLDVCRLGDERDALPHELSGGQQQRVALARAIAPRPRLLLLDEPFTGSDSAMRDDLIEEVESIIREQHSTALLVTHDQDEAFAMADRCGVLNAGALCQWDTPYNLYHRPNCEFVASFIGEGVMLDGLLETSTAVATEIGTIESQSRLSTALMQKGDKVRILMRPDDIVLANGHGAGIAATVKDRAFRGADICYTVATGQGTKLNVVLPSRDDLQIGAQVSIRPQVDHVVVFPRIA